MNENCTSRSVSELRAVYFDAVYTFCLFYLQFTFISYMYDWYRLADIAELLSTKTFRFPLSIRTRDIVWRLTEINSTLALDRCKWDATAPRWLYICNWVNILHEVKCWGKDLFYNNFVNQYTLYWINFFIYNVIEIK